MSITLGVIGYGGRISGIIRRLREIEPSAVIAAIADPRKDEVREKLGEEAAKVSFYADADEMLEKEKASLDAILIGTRCSLHTEMACKVAPTGLPLFLEKPVATNMEDLKLLKATFDKSSSEVVVSFPLRLTAQVQATKQIVDSGRIGTVEHVQAINNVPYGATYFVNWYRDNDETQGQWLQKATHDLDYVMYVLGQTPKRIAAMMSQRVYGRKYPAGKYCRDCDEQETCQDSPWNYKLRGQSDYALPERRMCGFGVDAKNEDNGSALVEFESGMHVVYTQNFFARRDAAMRGAIFIGYSGTIRFDWCTNVMEVIDHHRLRTDKVECTARGGHGGGDQKLLLTFLDIIRGKAKSRSPLSAGIMSAHLCLKAKQSCLEGRFVDFDPAELDR